MPEQQQKCFIQDDKLTQIILKSSNVDIIGSYMRTWIDRNGIPFKYEFQTQDGSHFYYNPDEVKCNA